MNYLEDLMNVHISHIGGGGSPLRLLALNTIQVPIGVSVDRYGIWVCGFGFAASTVSELTHELTVLATAKHGYTCRVAATETVVGTSLQALHGVLGERHS